MVTIVQKSLICAAVGAVFISSAPAYAVNECGAGANGATVTCNGDGSPASDSNPYASGITYTNPVHLIIDGTVTPINSTGRIGVQASGTRSMQLLGDVNVNITNPPGSNYAAVGDFAVRSGDFDMTIGPLVDLTVTQNVSNRSLSVVGMRGDTTNLTLNSQANIDATNSIGVGTIYFRGYSLNTAPTAGNDSSINATIGGSITMVSHNVNAVQALYAAAQGVGSSSVVTVNSTADIDVTTTGAQTNTVRGILALNANGGVYVRSAGDITMDSASAATSITGINATSVNGDVVVDLEGGIAADTSSDVFGILAETTNGSNIIDIASYVEMAITSTANDASALRLTGSNGAHVVTIDEGANITADGVTGGYALSIGGGSYDITLANDVVMEASATGVAHVISLADTSGGTVEIGAGSFINAAGGTESYVFEGSALGADIFTSYGSFLNGDILTEGGADEVNILGGLLIGRVEMGAGNDVFISTADIFGNIVAEGGADEVRLMGGSLDGSVNMGTGADILTIADMNAAGLSGIGHVLGGNGSDTLSFENITYFGSTMAVDDLSQGINLMDDWETINFVNSDWRLTGDLTLGGSTVNIDSTSTLYAGNGVNSVISSIIPGDRATVNNAGVIDLTNGASGATDTLTILGDYVGANGEIRLNIAGSGGAFQSDRLIIDGSNGGGSASGNSVISLVDTQFLGGPTSGNGILLIETVNGATSSSGAFILASPVAAGAYNYRLEINGGNDNWYLVSGFAPRNEIAADVALPDLSHRLGLAMLGRMEDRQNDDGRKFWARSFGQFGQVGETGNFAAHGPEYDYTVAGGQMGIDVYRTSSMEKTRDVVGVYGASGHIKADVASPAGGNAGVSQMTGYSVGAYWTRLAAQGWYVDTALQGTFYDNVRSRSDSGETLTTHGYGATASVEGGKSYVIDKGLTLTPQVQVTAQKTKLNDSGDSFGLVDFRDANAVYTRVGAKLDKTIALEDGPVNVWVMPGFTQSFGANAKTVVTNLSGGGASTFRTDLGGSAILLNTGISASFSENISLFTSAEYSTALSRNGNALAGKVGIKVAW